MTSRWPFASEMSAPNAFDGFSVQVAWSSDVPYARRITAESRDFARARIAGKVGGVAAVRMEALSHRMLLRAAQLEV